jgi:hypothetical protein
MSLDATRVKIKLPLSGGLLFRLPMFAAPLSPLSEWLCFRRIPDQFLVG